MMIKILDFCPDLHTVEESLQMITACKMNWAKHLYGGRAGTRTPDLLRVKQAL